MAPSVAGDLKTKQNTGQNSASDTRVSVNSHRRMHKFQNVKGRLNLHLLSLDQLRTAASVAEARCGHFLLRNPQPLAQISRRKADSTTARVVPPHSPIEQPIAHGEPHIEYIDHASHIGADTLSQGITFNVSLTQCREVVQDTTTQRVEAAYQIIKHHVLQDASDEIKNVLNQTPVPLLGIRGTVLLNAPDTPARTAAMDRGIVSSVSRLFIFFFGASRVWKKKTEKCMIRDLRFF